MVSCRGEDGIFKVRREYWIDNESRGSEHQQPKEKKRPGRSRVFILNTNALITASDLLTLDLDSSATLPVHSVSSPAGPVARHQHGAIGMGMGVHPIPTAVVCTQTWHGGVWGHGISPGQVLTS